MKKTLILAPFLSIGLGVGVWMAFHHRNETPKRTAFRQEAFILPTTEKEISRYIEANKGSKDVAVKRRVAQVSIKEAYLEAGKGKWSVARERLLGVSKATSSDVLTGEFGTVSDEARYQAACCLVGEGQKKAAEKEFRDFIVSRPTSPLATAAFRRIARLHGGEAPPDANALFQASLDKQEHLARLEASSCGPKCLEHLQAILNHKVDLLSENQFATLCGTNGDGTALAGMRRGLKALGCDSYCYELSREDFLKAPLPCIQLIGEHYVVVEKRDGDHLSVFDPLKNETTDLKVSDSASSSYSVILLSPLSI